MKAEKKENAQRMSPCVEKMSSAPWESRESSG